ncbi:MAG: AMP-binding protein [Atopobiaceae bacterium]|jgi:acyl-coenzyme A synthetase/AMP-(fatty) acid ligase|nr:AMP-binding protein [Atopobiaceae bacterium]MCH4120155.1 AMP-binding protein [Atopobiaceae bacterium]MCI1318617.1 AMP-binding protein [Atopobiaceae bacterium]MCI1389224.1 AMP-binding protein [Atopobiaceae bacterium]MCI1432765.1 AMP-binding protein [Atopobiaceae bacterium]
MTPTLLKQFEANVDAFGDRPAVVDQDGSVTTFAELDEASARVASWLAARGVGTETLVAIKMPRSMGYIACELACVKLGAGYIPLDGEQPQERVEVNMRECGCRLLMTAWEYEDALLAEPLPRAAEHAADPHDIAFVCYSSGSTGNPKPAAQEYGAYEPIIAAEAEDMLPYMRQPDGTLVPIRRALPSSFIFISSVMIITSSLWLGCPIYLPPDEICHDMGALGAYFKENGIDFVYLTPPAIKQLMEVPDLPLRIAHTGAEVTSELWSPDFTILNCYSSSELGYVVLGFEIDRPHRVTPVGRPKVGADLRLITPEGEPAEREGILCAYVPYFRGYLRRPEKNRTSFVELDGKRYFITNDLAEVDDDGVYLIRGRGDDAVEMGGRMVELSEVEGAMMRLCPELGQVAARSYTDSRGQAYFCVYYRADVPISRKRVREQIDGRIAPELRPRLLIRVSEFPLTSSGKINRRALRVPLSEDFLVGGL